VPSNNLRIPPPPPTASALKPTPASERTYDAPSTHLLLESSRGLKESSEEKAERQKDEGEAYNIGSNRSEHEKDERQDDEHTLA
jgi:hypothetical protein